MRSLVAVITVLALPASALAASAKSVDKTAPTVKITGLPKEPRCTSSARVGFNIDDKSGVKRILVFLDGDVVGRKTPSDHALKLFFPAKKRHPGRHRLGVLARDYAGNLARVVVHFRLCA